MRKILVLALLALMFSTAASAVAIVTPLCVNSMTLANLIGTGGCYVQDKLFSNWSYSGGGAVTDANVGINVIFSPVSGIDIHGFTFTPTGGVWVEGFTLGYTISVLPASDFSITGATDQFMLGPLSNASLARSLKDGGTVATFNLSQGVTTQSATFPGVKSLTSLTTVTIPEGALNFVASLEEDYVQMVIPEPVTMILIGSGLLGLGFIRRRAKKG